MSIFPFSSTSKGQLFPSSSSTNKSSSIPNTSTGSNPFSIFAKKQEHHPSLFPATKNEQKMNPFSNPEFRSRTPERKEFFSNTITQPSFANKKTGNNPFMKQEVKPATSQNSLFSFGKTTRPVSSTSIQSEVAELLQLKKDSHLHKQMIEQMLRRIKQLETRNTELETQKNELLQRNILLENTLKTNQLQLGQQVSNFPIQPNIQQVPHKQEAQLPNLTAQKMPIQFDYSKKDQLFPKTFSASILNEDEISPNAFTQKTFLTTDGYAIQCYVAFNAFYAIKYIILQKLKNNYGYIDLTNSTAQKIKIMNKESKSKNWFLFHKNSNRNVISPSMIDELAKNIVGQMRQGQNTPVNISINLSNYIEITESHCTVYHPEWTIATSFELQLYNYLNYNGSNQDTRHIIKQNVDEWIKEKTEEHQKKKMTHQLLMWFDDKLGIFHIVWQ